MLMVNVTKIDKNGKKEIIKMKFKGTREQYLELERLTEIAEDYFVDESESWR